VCFGGWGFQSENSFSSRAVEAVSGLVLAASEIPVDGALFPVPETNPYTVTFGEELPAIPAEQVGIIELCLSHRARAPKHAKAGEENPLSQNG
jgi:hypothetical protein